MKLSRSLFPDLESYFIKTWEQFGSLHRNCNPSVSGGICGAEQREGISTETFNQVVQDPFEMNISHY